MKRRLAAAAVVVVACARPAPPPPAGPAPEVGRVNPWLIDCAAERPGIDERLAADPEDAGALIGAGLCDVTRGDSEAGIPRLQEGAVRATAADDLVRAGIGFQIVAKPEMAVAAFEKALIDDPNHPEALYRCGLVLFHNMGDKARAAERWRRFLEVAPASPQAEAVRRALAEIADL